SLTLRFGEILRDTAAGTDCQTDADCQGTRKCGRVTPNICEREPELMVDAEPAFALEGQFTATLVTAAPGDATVRQRAPRDIDWQARIDRARSMAAPCVLCEIRCGVDRLAGERGRCGLADTLPIYSQMLHFGEERALVPSWVVNLSGCSMHCT